MPSKLNMDTLLNMPLICLLLVMGLFNVFVNDGGLATLVSLGILIVLFRQQQELSKQRPTDSKRTPSIKESPRSHGKASDQPIPSLNTQDQASIPEWVKTLKGWVYAYFTEGNTVVRVGAIILLIGVGFLLKYSYHHTQLTIVGRLAAVFIFSIALLIAGWMLRKKRATYAHILQGSALGIKYLAIYASYNFYHLIPLEITFLILVLISILAVLLAFIQNASSLVVLSMIGAYLAPALTGVDRSYLAGFYLYYAFLNTMVLLLSRKHNWPLLNLLSFAFTFILSSLLGYFHYHSEHLVITEIALIVYFLQFTAIHLFSSLQQAQITQKYIHYSLCFGPPIIGFSLQTHLVQALNNGSGISALVLCLFYALYAMVLHRLLPAKLPLLRLTSTGLALLFFTISLPLLLEPQSLFPAWALEAALIVWMGTYQKHDWALYCGSFLQVLNGFWAFSLWQYSASYTSTSSLPTDILGHYSIAIAAFFSSYSIEKRMSIGGHKALAMMLFLWGCGWWLFAGYHGIDAMIVPRLQAHAPLALLSMSALLLLSIWHLNRYWLQVKVLPELFLACLGAILLHLVQQDLLLFSHMLWSLWLLAFICLLLTLYLLQDIQCDRSLPIKHTICYFFGCITMSLGLYQQAELYGLQALARLCLLLPSALLFFAANYLPFRWPFKRFRYAFWPCLFLGLWMYFYSAILSLFDSGQYGYLAPLFNPLDSSLLACLLLLIFWCMRKEKFIRGCFGRRSPWNWLFGLGFLNLSTIVIRAVHHYTQVPYQFHALFHSETVQSSLSILWTTVALGLMLVGNRQQQRKVWQLGAVLIALIVLKLFLIDLSSTGTLARIVSFIGVGSLLLAIGYVAPLPSEKGGQASHPPEPPRSRANAS